MNGVICGVPIEDFPVPSWNRGIKMTYRMTPKGVVVHNTWNTAKAKAEASYMVGNPKWVSFHSVVDEEKVVESIPFNYNSWHCGNQYGNTNYIGVEIARSKSDEATFLKAEDNGAKYIAGILKKYGWGIDKLYSHQQMNGKYCPHRTLDLGYERFKNKVRKYLGENVTSNPVDTNTDQSEYIVVNGGYSVKTSTPNDTLTIRESPNANSKKIGTYRDGSVIYVEKVYKSSSNGTWYKIPKVGFVSAKYCVEIPSTPKKDEVKPSVPVEKEDVKPKTDYQLVLYNNNVDRNYAERIELELAIPKMHLEDYLKVKDKYTKVIFVGGYKDIPEVALRLAGADRKETESKVEEFIKNNR